MKVYLTIAALLAATVSFSQQKKPMNNELQVATFGAGCFWCTEAVFLNVKGVTKVVSGYEGGKVKNPSYRDVCTGETGHAEVTQITYDPSKVSFEDLLEVFWNTHDPTTLNKQGADEGTQYRSVVFYADEEQKKIAEAYKKQLEASHVYKNQDRNRDHCRVGFLPGGRLSSKLLRAQS